MVKSSGGSEDYVKALVYVFIALGLFIIAIVAAYFGAVGLYFGQAIVEVDVFEDKYKFYCDDRASAQNCTSFNTSDPLPSWSAYETFRDDINATIPLYIGATTVLFSLLALVFLFLALKTSGLWKGEKSASKNAY